MSFPLIAAGNDWRRWAERLLNRMYDASRWFDMTCYHECDVEWCHYDITRYWLYDAQAWSRCGSGFWGSVLDCLCLLSVTYKELVLGVSKTPSWVFRPRDLWITSCLRKQTCLVLTQLFLLVSNGPQVLESLSTSLVPTRRWQRENGRNHPTDQQDSQEQACHQKPEQVSCQKPEQEHSQKPETEQDQPRNRPEQGCQEELGNGQNRPRARRDSPEEGC